MLALLEGLRGQFVSGNDRHSLALTHASQAILGTQSRYLFPNPKEGLPQIYISLCIPVRMQQSISISVICMVF